MQAYCRSDGHKSRAILVIFQELTEKGTFLTEEILENGLDPKGTRS